MREDTFTNTVDGAAYYERMRDGRDYGDRDDRPSRGEAEYDAYLDRLDIERQRKRDEIDRAAGRYVPSDQMRLAVSILCWKFPAIATREGVAWISAATYEQVVEGLDAEKYEVQRADGGVWVRIKSIFEPDPWAIPHTA